MGSDPVLGQRRDQRQAPGGVDGASVLGGGEILPAAQQLGVPGYHAFEELATVRSALERSVRKS